MILILHQSLHRVVGCWNALDQHTVDAPSIKRRLDKL